MVVLLSQRRPRWREQVGLPIVEALAHGCNVLTTRETGLAEWLADHGHRVLPNGSDVSAISRALVEVLLGQRDSTQVLAALPAVDGRLTADTWLVDVVTQPAVGPSIATGRQ